MAENANQEDEFAGIPEMPSDENIRAELLRTGGPEHWNPFGEDKRAPTDFHRLPKDIADKVIRARLAAGPGPNGTEWQHVIWEQHRRMAELDKEHDAIVAQLEEVRSFDPKTGKPVAMAISSPERRKAMGARLLEIADEQARIEGEPGQRKMEKKLAEAVLAEKRKIKNAYILKEAKRRAASSLTEDAIERLASGFRKTAPSA